jgi:phosphoribosyl 1,2-cyclic phosphodiesterase
VKFTNLGSGSGGNASVVSFDGQALLVDCGLPKARILAGLRGLRLKGVLITHRHGDHLKAHASNLGAPLFVEEANWRDARRLKMVEGRAEHFYEMPFRVGSFRVTPFALPHPGRETWNSWGFRIEAGGSSIAYATDLGHVTDAVVDAMSGADLVFLESNHDVTMERESLRPDRLVEWVLSDHGHLSNDQCAAGLARIKGPHTVVLGHLSRDCNTPALARAAAKKATSARLVLADQDEGTKTISI